MYLGFFPPSSGEASSHILMCATYVSSASLLNTEDMILWRIESLSAMAGVPSRALCSVRQG